MDLNEALETVHEIGFASEVFEGILSDEDVKAIETIIDTVEDVQPVVHAKWELVNEDENVYMCSNCGDEFITIDGTATGNHMIYCPFCGAKMDKE